MINLESYLVGSAEPGREYVLRNSKGSEELCYTHEENGLIYFAKNHKAEIFERSGTYLKRIADTSSGDDESYVINGGRGAIWVKRFANAGDSFTMRARIDHYVTSTGEFKFGGDVEHVIRIIRATTYMIDDTPVNAIEIGVSAGGVTFDTMIYGEGYGLLAFENSEMRSWASHFSPGTRHAIHEPKWMRDMIQSARTVLERQATVETSALSVRLRQEANIGSLHLGYVYPKNVVTLIGDPIKNGDYYWQQIQIQQNERLLIGYMAVSGPNFPGVTFRPIPASTSQIVGKIQEAIQNLDQVIENATVVRGNLVATLELLSTY